jgi:leucyl aminopeptidase
VKSPYVHLDIAGPSFLEAAQDYKGKGGTGVGIRLLMNYLQNYK